ncbi:MAG: DUF2079 domain-containing protein [Lachnospiraceae bacterium]|nr:DUF2079 domain-containing protein [Lachnospiraceae bacterium]
MKTINRVLPGVIRKIFIAWLFAAVISFYALDPQDRLLTGSNSMAKTSLASVILCMAACFAVLAVSEALLKGSKKAFLIRAERWLLPLLFALLSIPALIASYATPFLIAILAIFILLVVYAVFGWDAPKAEPVAEEATPAEPAPVTYGGAKAGKAAADATGTFLQKHKWLVPGILVGVLALLVFAFQSLWTVSRVMYFKCPTYDMGIAAQMYHSMLKNGSLVTTVERAEAMSHLKVHFILVYYLWLPFYAIVPHPATLEVMQAATLVASVIPLWLLLKNRFRAPWLVAAIAAIFLLYPPLSMGISYDVHENCFLPVLILWLLWSLERDKKLLAALFTALLLVVKEDAAVYAAVIAIGFLLTTLLRANGKKALYRALFYGVLLVASVGWFLFTTSWLKAYGDGIMNVHYRNFFFGEHRSFSAVIYAVILSPMKVLFECVREDETRLVYFAPTLVILLGLPFVTRKYERLIFTIPYFLVNLVSSNIYQHDIFFQYSFGSCTLLFCLAVMNWNDLRKMFSRKKAGTVWGYAVLGLMAVACVTAFGITSKKGQTYIDYHFKDTSEYEARWELLSTIPKDAEVAAGTFVTTQVWDRDLLWDIKTNNAKRTLESEYAVFYKADEKRYREKFAKDLGITDPDMTFYDMLLLNGFVEQGSTPGGLAVYRKNR